MAALIVILSLAFTNVIYTILWRIFFSPIANFPGPKLAALTSWYEFYYDVIQPGQFVFHIQDLHTLYGPIIRITPWEIHIQDPAFLDEIYAPASQQREKYSFFVRTLKLPGAIGATIKHETHRKRREALNTSFSKKRIVDYEPIIRDRSLKLCRVVEKHSQDRTPINLSDLYFAFANDVVSYYCFGDDDNLLGNENRASVQRNNMVELLLGIKINLHFPWIFDLLDLIPFHIAKNIMPPGVLDMVALSKNVRKHIEKVLKNVIAHKTQTRSVIRDLHDNQDLPPSEKSIDRLENEGTLLVMAGTDSTAKSMAITHFYLLQNPEVMSRVREELQTLPQTASWTELEQLPYFSGCIAEGNRLSFGVTTRTCRIAVAETLHYKQYSIPPGTPMSETSLSVHTNETIFPEPWEFRPERWMGKEGMNKKKYQMAFNKGGRVCIGMNFAHAEMFLCLAAMVRYNMELFETDILDVKFQHDFHVGFPRLDSKGVRAMVLPIKEKK